MRVEQNVKGAGAGKVRLTCRVTMILHLRVVWSLADGHKPLSVPPDERERAIGALQPACEAGLAAVAEAKTRTTRVIPLGESGYTGPGRWCHIRSR
jgi:hypothetical protein